MWGNGTQKCYDLKADYKRIQKRVLLKKIVSTKNLKLTRFIRRNLRMTHIMCPRWKQNGQ